jgi:ketosteroid isomerase-like protein
MKKLLFLISFVAISCQSPYGSVTTTDQKSKIVEELFKNVSDENIDYLKEVFSDEMEFVDSKGNTLNKEGFIAGVENIFGLFDNIQFEEADADAEGSEIETTAYENGIIWTNIWNTFSATGKYTGQQVSFPFHISYKWKGNQIIKEVQFFDSSTFENEMNAKQSALGTAEDLVFNLELQIRRGVSKATLDSFLERIGKYIRLNEPMTSPYGYFKSEKSRLVTLIERYPSSTEALQHVVDFENGPFFDEFNSIFEFKRVEIIGNPSAEFRKKADTYGADYRPLIGGWIK